MSNQEKTKVAKHAGLPRWFDVTIAVICLLLGAPLLGLMAILIALTSRGPIFFRQDRVGLNGRLFKLYKLRTMRASNEGFRLATQGDPRVTLVGSLLRKLKLDELPQFWNILKGDMSLVGPRPEVPQYVNLNNPRWRRVLSVRPGLTDHLSLLLANEEKLLSECKTDPEHFYLKTLQPFKIRGYLEYLEQRTWRTDLKVLLNTATIVVFRGDASLPTVDQISMLETRNNGRNGHHSSSKSTLDTTVGQAAMNSDNDPSTKKPRLWWKPFQTKPAQFALDLLVLVCVFAFTYLLRFDFAIPKHEFVNALTQLPYVVLIQFAALCLSGAYAFIWRYIGMSEIKTFLKAAGWSVLPILVLRLALPAQFQSWRVPLSIIVMDTILAFGGVLGLRVVRRGLYEQYEKRPKTNAATNGNRKAVLLIGAGRAGMLAAREIMGHHETDLEVKGFIDDDPNKLGSMIHGIKVLGPTRDLPLWVPKLKIDHVVITMAGIPGPYIREIAEFCERIPVKVRIIPGLYDILRGKVEVSRIRDVEIEDLLGRMPVKLDVEDMRRFLADKTVMVTGAGGSIGSELAQQVAEFQPASLLLVERSEFALFEIEREMTEAWPDLPIVQLVADVGDEGRMRAIFKKYHPQVILHAAAHKHVPIMEDNIAEAVKNNVLATHLLGVLAGEFGAEAFVLISTDKAVRPTSVMGASKRFAELVVQDLDKRFLTRYVAVRFGNVIGSTGSVITVFQKQIRKGRPITVTHPDMVRYFMTIREAAQLVLQASAMGQGGEIFILDMGEPVRILDLAKHMLNLSGLKPFVDVDIVFTGIRPGEKLIEELQITEESMNKTRHPKIFIGKIAAYPQEKVRIALDHLAVLSKNGHETELRNYLGELLPEAQFNNSGKKAAASAGGSQAE
ncbi:MAG TPA: polysaccharide biosynthesis protein [Pyrinomonadaceae bacterium]|nr:polysaccharide biosynthesis protein [Pyrinomonadaceae bacterium]